mmetsp:Transcript_16963/g.48265  ORF Transcript_16963/g.48265 Transcript_16963/m.48265 type:complete len:112 (-) Transcript_16963:786-1121(-)
MVAMKAAVAAAARHGSHCGWSPADIWETRRAPVGEALLKVFCNLLSSLPKVNIGEPGVVGEAQSSRMLIGEWLNRGLPVLICTGFGQILPSPLHAEQMPVPSLNAPITLCL